MTIVKGYNLINITLCKDGNEETNEERDDFHCNLKKNENYFDSKALFPCFILQSTCGLARDGDKHKQLCGPVWPT